MTPVQQGVMNALNDGWTLVADAQQDRYLLQREGEPDMTVRVSSVRALEREGFVKRGRFTYPVTHFHLCR